jgi:hypothetical protein
MMPTDLRPSAMISSATQSVIETHGIGQPADATCSTCCTAASGVMQNLAPHRASNSLLRLSSIATFSQSLRAMASRYSGSGSWCTENLASGGSDASWAKRRLSVCRKSAEPVGLTAAMPMWVCT